MNNEKEYTITLTKLEIGYLAMLIKNTANYNKMARDLAKDDVDELTIKAIRTILGVSDKLNNILKEQNNDSDF